MLILLSLFAPLALAGPGDGRGTVAERVDDRRDLADDRADLHAIVDAAERWNRAMNTGDRALERSADAAIAAWLRQEFRENRQDVGEARREVGRSSREVRGSRSERVATRSPDSRRDVRDDRRDRRDDVSDRNQARLDQVQTRRISDQLAALQPRFTAGNPSPTDVAAKRRLLNELRGLALRELGEDREELREDRREGREDRRERRE